MLKHIIKIYKYSKLIRNADSFLASKHYGNFLINVSDIKTLSCWYSNEIQWSTAQIDNLEKKYRINSCCKKACFECCKQSIYINPAEYEILKYNILRLDYKTKAKLKLEAKNICAAIKKTQIPTKFSKGLTEKEQEDINKEYFQFQFKCPLLNCDRECICYDIRPSVCWTYRNYGDAIDCSGTCTPPYGHPYISSGTRVTKKLYETYIQKSQNYRLLPYAIYEILKNFN
ncbi:hypothetical protein [Clostridium sp. ZBS4]|uniref:hypothetical protein n=1 Tax=Clostridium sp. ZBS4 TaxID=2949974 RepID=UPI00207AF367|nr:hypothetical protein [Clostridium sp. ZBS4]